MEIDGNTIIVACALLGQATALAVGAFKLGNVLGCLQRALVDIDKRLAIQDEDRQALWEKKQDKTVCSERHT